jgi:hypothetical protein
VRVMFVLHQSRSVAHCICGCHLKFDEATTERFDGCGLESYIICCRACGGLISAVVDPFDGVWVISDITNHGDAVRDANGGTYDGSKTERKVVTGARICAVGRHKPLRAHFRDYTRKDGTCVQGIGSPTPITRR